MIWEVLLGAALEAGLGLIATVGFEEEVRDSKERFLKTTEKARRKALEKALDRATRAAGYSAISPLLHEPCFQEEVIGALLDPITGFDVAAISAEWQDKLPTHALAFRRFFTSLEQGLMHDETWGPIVQRYQDLRYRQAVLQALAQKHLDLPPQQLVHQINAHLTASGAIAQEGSVAAGAGGMAIKGDVGQIIQIGQIIVQEIVAQGEGGVAYNGSLGDEYLRELASDANLLPWSRIFEDYADPNKKVTFDLEDVYTALDTTEMEEIQEEEAYRRLLVELRMARRERVSAQEMLNRCDQLLLMGDPGSGKSTFSKYVAYVLAKANLAEEPSPWLEQLSGWEQGALFPLRLELRDLAAFAATKGCRRGDRNLFRQYLTAMLAEWGVAGFETELFKQMRNEGDPMLFLLDGLDEVPTKQRQLVVDVVNDLCRHYKGHHYLVTCRPYAYIGQPWRLVGFKEATLAPFDAAQIEQFTGNWYGQLVKLERLKPQEAQEGVARFQQEIKHLHLEHLAQNPLLLTAMTHLHVFKHKLPDDRVALYDDIVKLLFERWEKHLGKDEGIIAALDIPGLKQENLMKALSRVAYRAHARQQLGENEEAVTADIDETELCKWLRPDLGGSLDKAEQFMQYIRERAGLLIRHKTESYTFPHRTFQEFLAARYLATQSDKDLAQEVNRLAQEDLTRWREVLVLAAGYVAKQERTTQAIAVANELCPFSVAECPAQDDPVCWQRALLAAEALLEIGLPGVRSEDSGMAVLMRVLGWLTQALRVDSATLAASERAAAGRFLAKLGDSRPKVLDPLQIEWIDISAGPFEMGTMAEDLPPTDNEDVRRWLEAETPRHTFEIAQPYRLGRYPITVAQYRLFIEEEGYKKADYWREAAAAGLWREGKLQAYTWDIDLKHYEQGWVTGPADYGEPFTLANHPQVGVSWYEALAFSRWLTGHFRGAGLMPDGWRITLPSEAQWEKASRSGDGRTYPWGEEVDPNKANYHDSGIGTTSAVGCFPAGESPYGVEEMSGSVFEWTRSLWGKEWPESEFKYPYNPDDGRENLKASADYGRVLRGGSFGLNVRYVRCAYRNLRHPHGRYFDVGFRVVFSPSTTEH
ncbi:MAG: SUMF1/EgtB/PvdO family nonheme iron enzyme [Halieaceae bacterium]|nr:SUMF1/EgtB/PvdO family nonheme iron enzyme [Halieaceae bacterium]